MATCLEHSFYKCVTKVQNCTDCCASSAECSKYYIQHLVGSANNLQVGDKIWLSSACEGEVAPAGIYMDCGAGGACSQNVSTRIYGCVTVGSSGLVTAIAACTGEVTCGSGAGESCEQSSFLDTQADHRWQGRQKTKVDALDTWETLYQCPTQFDVTTTVEGVTCYTNLTTTNSVYLKQIYIQNCDKGSTNEKKFSVRLYNANTGTVTATDCNLVNTVIPAEMSLADKIKLDDNQRVKILEHESPLYLGDGDVIQIAAHTSKTGWVISAWLEHGNQNYVDDSYNMVTGNGTVNDGVNAVANMSGLSRKLGTGTANRRLKPGGSTSG